MAASSKLTLAGEMAVPTTVGENPRRLRTVVVDDSATFLQVTCHLLDLEEVIDLVAAASDGAEAIDTVMRVKPALVLMDVHMPGLDGLSATSLLAQMCPAPTVVLMSSEDTPQLRAACRRAGAFDLVPKENFRDELEPVLQRVLEMREDWRLQAQTASREQRGRTSST
jgi:CheY-like chemotaxis protein